MAVHGYDGSSIQTIAQEAELSSGLIHYHFANKLEILLAALDRLVESHSANVERSLSAVPPHAADQVGAFLDAHLGLGAHADPVALNCWVLMSGEALRHPEVGAAYAAALESLVGRLSKIVAFGILGGELEEQLVPRDIAAALVATIQGYFTLAAVSRDLVPQGSALSTARSMASGLLGVAV